jgi:tRNA wybutosine-synthesizing protein 3
MKTRGSRAEHSWDTHRLKALQQFQSHLSSGRVDPDIVDFLKNINSTSNCYTTSSCSGRIQLSAGQHPGAKGELLVLAKWHRPITIEELSFVLANCDYPSLWFSVHPPIFHIVARDLRVAHWLLITARNTGFKHSGIQGVGRRIIVEIMSMERLEVPLRYNGDMVIKPEQLPALVNIANYMLKKGKDRLRLLEKELLKVCMSS